MTDIQKITRDLRCVGRLIYGYCAGLVEAGAIATNPMTLDRAEDMLIELAKRV